MDGLACKYLVLPSKRSKALAEPLVLREPLPLRGLVKSLPPALAGNRQDSSVLSDSISGALHPFLSMREKRTQIEWNVKDSGTKGVRQQILED
jgi:hypothetical protein